MFLKWREENRHLPLQYRWYAYLAKSSRVQGKPRQEIITYLASIPVRCAHKPNSADWRTFWYKAHCSLLVVQADFRTYQQTMGALKERVTPPTREDMGTLIAEEFANHPSWHKDYQTVCRVIERSAFYLE